jgi:dTDP-4-dehydrorhamnose 3,5-epimerase
MIAGVMVKKLKVIADERGRLMDMLRAADELFSKFGQVYLTAACSDIPYQWDRKDG